MAYEFPRYLSKGQATTDQPSFLAAEDTRGERLNKIAQGAQTAQNAVFKFGESYLEAQKTQAELNQRTQIDDLLSRAEADPDYNSFDKYQKENEKIKNDSISGFKNRFASGDAIAKADYYAKTTNSKLQSIFRKKMIDNQQANLLSLLDRDVAIGNLDSIKSRIEENKKNGFIDATDAYKLEEKYIAQAKFNSFLYDFRTNPNEAEKKVLEGSYGMDAETSEKARLKLKELKYIQREQEGNLYGDMGLRVTTGEITDDEIDNAIALNKQNPNEGITEAHGNTLKAALYRDVTKRIGQKEFKKYKQAIDFVFSNSSQDKFKGYEAILAAYTDGLTAEETNFLKQILETKKDIVFANKAAAGKKMIEQIFGAKAKDVQKETKALLSYAKRISDGLSPEKAAQETTIDVIQEDHPAIVADPDLAVAFTPGKGLKAITKVKNESSTTRQK